MQYKHTHSIHASNERQQYLSLAVKTVVLQSKTTKRLRVHGFSGLYTPEQSEYIVAICPTIVCPPARSPE